MSSYQFRYISTNGEQKETQPAHRPQGVSRPLARARASRCAASGDLTHRLISPQPPQLSPSIGSDKHPTKAQPAPSQSSPSYHGWPPRAALLPSPPHPLSYPPSIPTTAFRIPGMSRPRPAATATKAVAAAPPPPSSPPGHARARRRAHPTGSSPPAAPRGCPLHAAPTTVPLPPAAVSHPGGQAQSTLRPPVTCRGCE